MKSTTTFKRGVAKVRRDWQEGHYDVALKGVDRLLKDWPDNPQLLVMWADLIQLQEKTEGPSLDDAKAAYRRAVELEEEYPSALVELGHFLYALEDDPRSANKVYEKAIVACRRLLIEALLGKAKALHEIGGISEARACLDEAYMLRLRDPDNTDLSGTFEEVMGALNQWIHVERSTGGSAFSEI
jgi:tetratricopeptide (TPR) repeat protein